MQKKSRGAPNKHEHHYTVVTTILVETDISNIIVTY